MAQFKRGEIVVTILSSLLGQIRGKRQERFTSTAEQYDDCVHKLAAGQEVDLDLLAQLLDELDRSDSDLEADVSDKQRRIEARVELDRISQLSKDLPPKRAKIAKLQEELASFIAAKKPAIEALAAEIRQLELEVGRAGFVESDLLNVGIPLALQNRKDALAKRQRSLGEKRERHRDMTEQAKRAVDAAKVRLTDVNVKLSRATVPYDVELIKQEAATLERRIEAYQQHITAWQPLADEIAAEQAATNEESLAIRKALMNP